jgi:5-methylcytosine-specific restriction protein A
MSEYPKNKKRTAAAGDTPQQPIIISSDAYDDDGGTPKKKQKQWTKKKQPTQPTQPGETPQQPIVISSDDNSDGDSDSDSDSELQSKKTHKKKQRKVSSALGYNTTDTQEEKYAAIESKIGPYKKCTKGVITGCGQEKPIREFHFNTKNITGLQDACIPCQRRYRKRRILNCRKKYGKLTKEQIRENYKAEYGTVKKCSVCEKELPPESFTTSQSMEIGLHNQCYDCASKQSRNGELREYIHLPDKDAKKYHKKAMCENCGGTDKLAIDHILPIAKGGNDCLVNKQTLCTSCNSSKSDTIAHLVTLEQLCERYRDSCRTLDFTNYHLASMTLAKLVNDFKKTHLSQDMETLRASLSGYQKKHNMRHKLDRIMRKIEPFCFSS